MNSKQIACIIVALFIALLVQSTLWVKGINTKAQKAASDAESKEFQASNKLTQERAQLAELNRQSQSLIDFLKIWQPHFEAFDNAQSAEVNFQMNVKQSNLLNLSQRFERAKTDGNKTIPEVLRGYITFEDSYGGLLNWLGKLESENPTVRVSSIKLGRGTRATDLRVDVVVDRPILKK